jgi:hypothetical protein
MYFANFPACSVELHKKLLLLSWSKLHLKKNRFRLIPWRGGIMRRIILLSILGLIGSATIATAGTISVTSSSVNYRVNVGPMYVSHTPLINVIGTSGQKASVFPNATGGFNLKVTPKDQAYTDAGIIIGFDGSLLLGNLESLTFESTGDPIALSLFLDTSGNGQFLSFSEGVYTGEGGDSTFIKTDLTGHVLDSTTSLAIWSLNGTRQPSNPFSYYTLSQLQSGTINGINSSTRVAIWLGINSDSSCVSRCATLSNIQLTTVAEPSVLLLLGIGIGAVALLSMRRTMHRKN